MSFGPLPFIGRLASFGPPRPVRMVRARPSVPSWCRFGSIPGIGVTGHQGVTVWLAVFLLEPTPRGDAPNELRVTRNQLDDLGRQVHVGSRTVLDSLPTAFAKGDRDLIGAAPAIGRSSQNLARQLEEKRVVVH